MHEHTHINTGADSTVSGTVAIDRGLLRYRIVVYSILRMAALNVDEVQYAEEERFRREWYAQFQKERQHDLSEERQRLIDDQQQLMEDRQDRHTQSKSRSR